MLITDDPFADAAAPAEESGNLLGPGFMHVIALRAALGHFGYSGDRRALEQGFASARALIASRSALGEAARPDLTELRLLADEVPEFGQLLTVASGEAETAVKAAAGRLWASLGLMSPPDGWSASERDTARMVFACACGPASATGPAWVQASLRRLSAARLATALTDQLSANEDLWMQTLGERYASLRHRCAPRTMIRSRGLSDLVRDDANCRAAVTRRLEGWLAEGARVDLLGAHLEAAVVHVRTPDRIA